MERRKLTLNDWMAVTATTLGISIGVTTVGAIAYDVHNKYLNNSENTTETEISESYEITDDKLMQYLKPFNQTEPVESNKPYTRTLQQR